MTRQQALHRGMSPDGIRHALGRGQRWQRVVPGIYASFTGPLTPRHRLRAALLHAGPSAVVTGGRACSAHGMRYVPTESPLVLLVPTTVSRQKTALADLRRVPVMPRYRLLQGIPVALPERAVLDACHGAVSLREVRAMHCESVQRGLTTPDRLSAELGGACWKGAALCRRALDDVFVGCRFAPECELRDLVRTSLVLSEPLWNHRLPGSAGIVPDACWPAARVVVEIDSSEWHRMGDLVELTERRRARYAALGWTTVPISPRRLRDEPATVLHEIEEAVKLGCRRGTPAA